MHLTRVLLERLGRRTEEQRKELIKLMTQVCLPISRFPRDLRKAKLTKKSFLYWSPVVQRLQAPTLVAE